MQKLFDNVFKKDGKLLVENPIKDYRPFDDELVEEGKKQYRVWNERRSKAAAAIIKNIKDFPIKEGQKILYLGSAHGYTPSFIANIVKDGIVYAVEFSERTFNDSLPIAKKYHNIIPIWADARKPEEYYWVEKVDVVYIDVAQPDETRILIRNAKEFLKQGGIVMMAVKSRSIDVTKSPNKIYQEEIKKLKNAGYEIIDWKTLDPLEKAHAFIIAKK